MQRKNSEVRVESVRADWKKSTLALFVVVLVVVLLIISSFLRLDAIGAYNIFCNKKGLSKMNSPITYVFLCRIIGTPLDSICIVRQCQPH